MARTLRQILKRRYEVMEFVRGKEVKKVNSTRGLALRLDTVYLWVDVLLMWAFESIMRRWPWARDGSALVYGARCLSTTMEISTAALQGG